MCEICPSDTLLWLFANYQRDTHPLAVRLKFAEILLQTAQNLGQGIAKYGEDFVTPLLRACSDLDPTLSASAFSVLATVCENIRLGSHPFVGT